MKSLFALTMLLISLNGCSSLNPAAMVTDALIPDNQPMLSVDAQVGDKEASLGSNIEVDADKVDNVVGRDTVKNDAQVINQTNVPTSWFIVGTLSFFLMTAVAVIGWMAPVPKWCRR